MAETKTTSAKQWKQRDVLTVPSGNRAVVRKVSIHVFLAQGIIPNALLGLLMPESSAKRDKKKDEEAAYKVLKDNPEMLKSYAALVDAATVHCVVEPKVEPIPNCSVCKLPPVHRNHPTDPALLVEPAHPFEEGERDPEKLYVDDVDFDDKEFIFHAMVMGGTRDVEQFRGGQAESVEPVLPSENVAHASSEVAGNRG